MFQPTMQFVRAEQERREQEIERAIVARRQTPARPSRRPSIRRAVGRRVIAIGLRIAAEPSLKLARSSR